MKRSKMPFGEKLAITLSAIALLVSIWSAVESRKASAEARWSTFRGDALATLEAHRRTYSHVTCLFYATGTHQGLDEFGGFKSNIDTLVSSLHELREADDATLAEFETRLDASRSSFRELSDALSKFKTHLAADELSRANSICGTEG
jgi:hypothetical protein